MDGSGDGAPALGVGAIVGEEEFRKLNGPTSQARLLINTRFGLTVGLLER